MSFLRRWAAPAVLTLALLPAAGCGKTLIDLSKVEDQLKASTEESQQAKVSSVDCPSEVEVEVGEKFSCTVHLTDGGAETVTLLIRDEDANLTLVKPPAQ